MVKLRNSAFKLHNLKRIISMSNIFYFSNFISINVCMLSAICMYNFVIGVHLPDAPNYLIPEESVFISLTRRMC